MQVVLRSSFMAVAVHLMVFYASVFILYLMDSDFTFRFPFHLLSVAVWSVNSLIWLRFFTLVTHLVIGQRCFYNGIICSS